MNAVSDIGFENDLPVPIVHPIYPDDDEDADNETRDSMSFELLQAGLLLVLNSGHANGTRARAVALARLFGVYSTDVEAARLFHLDRGNFSRTVRRLKKEIAQYLTPEKSGRIARKQR